MATFIPPIFQQTQRPTTVGSLEGITTEDELIRNPQWIADSKTIWKNQTGKKWVGTDADVARWNLGKQSKVGWNLTSAGLNAFEAQDWATEEKEAWARSLDAYANTDPTLRSVSRAAFWTIFDLPTLATFGWGAAARAIGGKAAAASVRFSFKKALEKSLAEEGKRRLTKLGAVTSDKAIQRQIAKIPQAKLAKMRKEVANNVAFNNAFINFGPAGAIYSGLFDIAHQDLESDVDPRIPDFDYKRFATNVFFGYGLGMGLGYATPKIVEKVGRSKFLRDALDNNADELLETSIPPDKLGLEKGTQLELDLANTGTKGPAKPVGAEKTKNLFKEEGTDEGYLVTEALVNNVQSRTGQKLNVMDLGSGAPVKEKDMVFPELGDVQIKIKEGKPVDSSGKKRYVPAYFDKKNNTIVLDEDYIKGPMFDQKAWTKPKVSGVAAMPEDAFKTRQEWFDFIKMHEIQHTLKKRLPNETKAAYENRINKAALDEIAKVNKEIGNKEVLPNVERLKKNTNAKVEGTDLKTNQIKNENLYMKDTEKGLKNKDVIVANNIFGNYDDPILAKSVIEDASKSLKDKGGYFIANIGPQKSVKLSEDIIEKNYLKVDPSGKPLSPLEGKGKRKTFKETKKGMDDIVEATRKEGADTIRETKTITGLREDELQDILSDVFEIVRKKTINGKNVFIAKNKIIRKPNQRNFSINPKNTFFDKLLNIKKIGKRWLYSNADLPKELEHLSATQRGALRGLGIQIQRDFFRLREAIVKGYGDLDKLSPEKFDEVMDKINFVAFEGTRDLGTKGILKASEVFETLPQPVKSAVLTMRKSITDYRKKLMPKTRSNPDGIGYIENNTDLHTRVKKQIDGANDLDIRLDVNRQYEIFDNPKFIETLESTRKGRNVLSQAKKFIRDQLRLDKEILNDVNLRIPAINYREALKAKKQNKSLYTNTDGEQKIVQDTIDQIEGEEINNILKSFLRKYSADDLREIQALGAEDFLKDTLAKAGESAKIKGAFFQRKDIPGVLRDVMGEYKNPFVNYANTVMKIAQTAENYKFEKEIQRLVANGKFPGVIYDPLYTGGKSLLEASKLAKYAKGTDKPLANLKADDLIFDAIKQGNELSPVLNRGWRTFLGAQALTRIAKTAYAPAAYPRNFVGAMVKAWAAGNLNFGQIKVMSKAWKGARSFDDDELLAATQKLAYLDIHGSGADIGALRGALDEAVNPNWWVDVNVMLGKTERLTKEQQTLGQFRKLNEEVLRRYQAMDDMWKWYSFENEKLNYRQVLQDKGIDPDKVIERIATTGVYKKGPKKGQQIFIEVTNLDKYAGQMVRAHMDNYGNVAQAIKAARRLPMADFIAYKTEQLRTTKNIVLTALRDIREGTELKRTSNGVKGNAQLAMGYKRLGSVISAVSAPTAIGFGTAYAFGLYDPAEVKIGNKTYELPYSKMEALRETSVPDYAVADEYAFMPFLQPKDGKNMRLFNISYLDPWAPIRAPLLAAFRGANGQRDLEERVKKGFADSSKKIFESVGPSMLLQALGNMLYNQDEYGRKINDQNETFPDRMKNTVTEFVKVFEPGALRDLRRAYDTAKFGVTRGGAFKLEPLGVAAKTVGVPYQYVEPIKSLEYKIVPYIKEMNAAGGDFYEAISDYHPRSEQDIIRAYEKSLRKEYKAANGLARLMMAAKATGLSNTDIIKSVTRDFGFPEKFSKRVARSMIINNKFIPTVRPLRKNLFKLKRAVEQRTGNKVNLFEVQKELNQIYKSYFGAQFSVADDLIITEEKN